MATATQEPQHFVVLGAGVIGLTTAIGLRTAFPTAKITLIARHFPGDYHVDYCSPWAGGNWCSSANDNGLLESFDRVTYERFRRICQSNPEAGIEPSAIRMIFDSIPDDSGILTKETGKLWYEELVGGLSDIKQSDLPPGAVFGFDAPSAFVINTQVYLQW